MDRPTMRYFSVSIYLCVFWVLLSGHFTLMLLSFGALSVAIVLWFLRRMERVDPEPEKIVPTLSLARYLLWLSWCVVKANVNVAKRILDPALPVHPVWTRLDTRVRTPLEKTFYANSITLTPGTLTTEVREDHFLVHSLSIEGIEELREGEMERRIRSLGV